MTWRSRRQHSVQLLPAVEGLLARLGVDKSDLRAVFVCTGPGGYAGLRVGVSTAKGLAFALGASIVGVGRLEVEAYEFADCGRPVCAVHRAGRGEVAWAVYEGPRGEWREVFAPRMSTPEALMAEAPPDALFCAEEGRRRGGDAGGGRGVDEGDAGASSSGGAGGAWLAAARGGRRRRCADAGAAVPAGAGDWAARRTRT